MSVHIQTAIPCQFMLFARAVCDMVLLAHHLVIASYLPVGGVDIPTASNILAFNLDRYANGYVPSCLHGARELMRPYRIFFLYFAGRLRSTETRLGDAVIDFNLAINVRNNFIDLISCFLLTLFSGSARICPSAFLKFLI